MATGIIKNYEATNSGLTVKTVTTYGDVGAGNVAILVGSNVPINRQSEIYNTLNGLLQKLVEDGFRLPAIIADYVSVVATIEEGKHGSVISEPNAATSVSETQLTVVYSGSFDNIPASTLNLQTSVESLLNKLLDDHLSAA